jgi:hypothetical protein
MKRRRLRRQRPPLAPIAVLSPLFAFMVMKLSQFLSLPPKKTVF